MWTVWIMMKRMHTYTASYDRPAVEDVFILLLATLELVLYSSNHDKAKINESKTCD